MFLVDKMPKETEEEDEDPGIGAYFDVLAKNAKKKILSLSLCDVKANIFTVHLISKIDN